MAAELPAGRAKSRKCLQSFDVSTGNRNHNGKRLRITEVVITFQLLSTLFFIQRAERRKRFQSFEMSVEDPNHNDKGPCVSITIYSVSDT
jgi:hypothetical protein